MRICRFFSSRLLTVLLPLYCDPRERLRSIVMSMSVCVSVCLFARISPEPRALSLPIFVHVAYVRGSVFLRRVHNRTHRLSPGMVFSIEDALCRCIWDPYGWECTVWAKYAIYDIVFTDRMVQLVRTVCLRICVSSYNNF